MNLNYFSDDLIAGNGLDFSMLKKISSGSRISPGFRDLMKKYYNYAKFYRKKSRLMIDKIKDQLEPRCQLSLEIVYNLYLQILERIDVQNCKFTTNELNPNSEEIENKIDLVVFNFNHSLLK